MKLPMRLLLLVVVLSGCSLMDPTRESERDERTRLDFRYVVLTELKDNLEERRREHAQILTSLEPFRAWPDDAALAASVHPDAGISSKPLGFYRIVTITSPGSEASAFLAAELLDSRGAGRVTVVRPGPASFSVDVAVIPFPKSAAATGPRVPVFDESAICFQACQQRRAFIVEVARRTAEREAEVGAVKDLPGDKKLLSELLQIQEKFGRQHDAFFHLVAAAPWAREVEEAWTSGPELMLRMKPGFDPAACNAVLPSVASCTWNAEKRVVVLGPVK